MKLSQLDTQQLTELLLDLADPVCAICMDEEAAVMLRALSGMGRRPVMAVAAYAAGSLLPLLLRKHRRDTLIILEALTGLEEQELLRQNGLETVRQVMDCADQELLAFFTCAAERIRGGSKAC